MRTVDRSELVRLARAARLQAYAPYSQYAVGAALLCASGRIYTGCNVENVSYGLTICAERTAVVKAVSEGDRDCVAIAVVTENGASPCGACRQMLSEFGPDMEVVIACAEGDEYEVYSLQKLLPRQVSPNIP